MGRPAGRRLLEARTERAEAGSDSFESLFVRRECPDDRVRASFCLNLCHTHSARSSYNSLARPMHDVHGASGHEIHDAHLHGACGVLNPENSVGDTEAGGQHFCVPGETKSLSTSTRSGVRRSDVYESAHPQQTPLKMHEETWAGLLRDQGPKIFREVEIVPGCAVVVACPSYPVLLSHMGEVELLGTCWVGHSWGKQFGLGYGCSGVPFKVRIFFFPCRSWRLGKEGVVPHSVSGPL